MKKDTTHGGYLSGPFTSLDAVAGTGCKATTETVTRLPDHWSSNEVKLGACPDGPWVQLRDYQGALSELDTLRRQLAEAEAIRLAVEQAGSNDLVNLALARSLLCEVSRSGWGRQTLEDALNEVPLLQRIDTALSVMERWTPSPYHIMRETLDAAIAAGEGK